MRFGTDPDLTGRMIALSGASSMEMTHSLRASLDAILVGVGTVQKDNPSLSVRLVPGESPLPLVVDPRLETPEGCKLLTSGACRRPWLLSLAGGGPGCDAAAFAARAERLRAAGATVLECASDPACPRRVALGPALVRVAGSASVRSVMVEGGARIIASVLGQSGRKPDEAERSLAQYVVVTVAPVFVGGTRAVASPLAPPATLAHDASAPRPRTDFPALVGGSVYQLGSDIIVHGRV